MSLIPPQSMNDLEKITETCPDGTVHEKWMWRGQLHSLNDEPAVIVDDGREHKWFTYGELNRPEHLGPAWIKKGGLLELYYNMGRLHRTDGPAFINKATSEFQWYRHDKLHRLDGPAVECTNGNRHWYLNGRLHRTDGPAVERTTGDHQWYLNDIKFDFDSWLEKVNISHQEKVMCKLVWG